MLKQKTKTFKEYLNENPDLYQGTAARNDEATQSVIYDWFQDRRVSSDRHFAKYFRRAINQNYHLYMQRLRIEPGVIGDTGRATNYDWLINQYEEYMNNSVKADSHISDNVSEADRQVNSSNTIQHSGEDKTVSANSSVDTSNSIAKNTGAGVSTGNSHGEQTGAANSSSRTGSVGRANPMTQDFTANDMSYNNGVKGYITDNGSTIEVGEDSSSHTNIKGELDDYKKDFPRLHIQNPTTTSDTYTGGGSLNHAVTDDNTTSNSANSGITDSNATAQNASSGESKNLYGSKQDGAGVSIEHGESIGNTQDASSGVSTDKHIRTGRSGETAEILKNVIEFINRSSSISFLVEKLEPCFINVFDEEED